MMTNRYEKGETQGVSPKAILAAALPALGTLIAVVVMAVVTGEVDRLELVTAITGFSGSLISGLGAYLASPGDVRYRAVVAAKRPKGARRAH